MPTPVTIVPSGGVPVTEIDTASSAPKGTPMTPIPAGGTPVTVVGEITGTAKGMIGESEQEYPTLRIKDLTKWDKSEVRRWAYGYPYPYPYYGGYYWHGARPFGFRYW